MMQIELELAPNEHIACEFLDAENQSADGDHEDNSPLDAQLNINHEESFIHQLIAVDSPQPNSDHCIAPLA